MKDKKKKYLSLVILLILLVGITVGYAALSSTLNISGTSTIGTPTWNVHFENISVTTGSVTATTAPTISPNGLTITYALGTALDQPGKFYEFTVDVKNTGTIPARLSAAPTVGGVSSAQDVYINYTFTHDDGSAPAAGETIAAGGSQKFKVRVEFDSNINPDQLPTTGSNLTLTVSMQYEQA